MTPAISSRELSQFMTPAWLAIRVAKWAWAGGDFHSVLEPAAGGGALILGLGEVDAGHDFAVVAYEIDGQCWGELDRLRDRLNMRAALHGQSVTITNLRSGDFLTWPAVPDESFDLALMNPPYEEGRDVAFVERAFECSIRVVGVFQSRIVHSKGRAEFWRWTDITRMAFLSDRPRFGGEYSAKTDFVVLDLRRRTLARKQGEASPAQIEWWSK